MVEIKKVMKNLKIIGEVIILFMVFYLCFTGDAHKNLSRGSPARIKEDVEMKKTNETMTQQKKINISDSESEKERFKREKLKTVDELVIQSIGLTMPIAQTTEDMTNYACKYQQETLGKSNYVLISHNYWTTFGKLSGVKRGDLIQVCENSKTISFKVVTIEIVDCHETEVLAATKDCRLTLITCHGQAGTTQRLIVVGKPI